MINIQRIIINPDWSARRAQNDIALIRTAKPISFNDRARPICLPPSENYNNSAGDMLTVAGYGYTTDNLVVNVLPSKLQMAQIPVVGMSSCRETYNRTRIPITDKMICAGSATSGRCTVSSRTTNGEVIGNQIDLTLFSGRNEG